MFVICTREGRGRGVAEYYGMNYRRGIFALLNRKKKISGGRGEQREGARLKKTSKELLYKIRKKDQTKTFPPSALKRKSYMRAGEKTRPSPCSRKQRRNAKQKATQEDCLGKRRKKEIECRGNQNCYRYRALRSKKGEEKSPLA